MNKCSKIAGLYIASLKVMALIHQNSHWTTKGANFYGNHLLFESLHNSALKNVDSAAEKFVGLFGDDVLDFESQTNLLNKILLKYKIVNKSPVQMSLEVEKDFIKLSRRVYDFFKNEGALSLGLDDMLMSISNQREDAVYHLQQILKK